LPGPSFSIAVVPVASLSVACFSLSVFSLAGFFVAVFFIAILLAPGAYCTLFSGAGFFSVTNVFAAWRFFPGG
jgi:hypothetical protein